MLAMREIRITATALDHTAVVVGSGVGRDVKDDTMLAAKTALLVGFDPAGFVVSHLGSTAPVWH
jgi:hypothetical protein